MSTKREIVEAAVAEWRKQGGGRYAVKRGAFDLPSWDWASYPYTVGIVVGAGPLNIPARLTRDADRQRRVTLGFVVVSRIDAHPQGGPDAESDLSELETIETHAANVIYAMQRTNAADGGPLIDGIENDDDAQSDVPAESLGYQGIVATITFHYTENE